MSAEIHSILQLLETRVTLQLRAAGRAHKDCGDVMQLFSGILADTIQGYASSPLNVADELPTSKALSTVLLAACAHKDCPFTVPAWLGTTGVSRNV
jgi:hypothetical protein